MTEVSPSLSVSTGVNGLNTPIKKNKYRLKHRLKVKKNTDWQNG